MFSRYIDNFDFKSRFRILKGGKISLIVSALLGSVIVANAAPTNGVVTSGNATITSSGNTTNINQTTQKASINWQNFNVNSNETVNFNQPNKNSITLNRVIGNEKSVIDGTLNANGQVWILNSNGILFSKDAKVNTSGLVATTAELSDKDFQDGNYNFKNSKSNSVVNLGTIDVSNNGYVVLASNEVRNSGTIKAIKGKVYLSGNSEYTINLNGNSIVNLIVTKGVLDAMVENSGTIVANGGEIYLTTNAVNELLKGVVNNTGIIEANSLDDVTGKVEVFAHGGTANVSGEIKAEGGFVETSGKKVVLKDDIKVKAKTWLIDPYDIEIVSDSVTETTITPSSGTYTAPSDSTKIKASTLVTALNAGTDVTVTTSGGGTQNGDITVNSDITWTTGNSLTLNADRNIYINSNITATNTTGKLNLYYGQDLGNYNPSSNYYIGSGAKVNLKAGQNFSTKAGPFPPVNYQVITTLGTSTSTTGTDLQGMQGNLSKKYVLGADITATGVWTSIGSSTNSFKGFFDGLGHSISSLYMYSSQGFFGYTDGATIQNVNLINPNLSGYQYVGSLIGSAKNSNINNVSIITNNTTSRISGNKYVGGLVGKLEGGTITNSSIIGSTITASNSIAGGLVGELAGGTITNSYVVNTKIGNAARIGGLVGDIVGITGSTIENSYFQGTLTGSSGLIGGLVGYIDNTNDSYTPEINIKQSYAVATIDGIGPIGGLVGSLKTNWVTLKFTDSFWDKEISGVSSSTGSSYPTTGISGTVTGKTTSEMQEKETFINSNWIMTEFGKNAYKYPRLTMNNGVNAWVINIPPTAVNYTFSSLSGNTYTYKADVYSLSDYWTASSLFGSNYSDWILGTDYSFIYGGKSVSSFQDAGTYSGITVSILNDNFKIKSTGNTDGSFTIAKKTLNVSGLEIESKTYDGTNKATVSITNSGTLNGILSKNNIQDDVSFTTDATFNSKDVQNTKTVNLDYTLTGEKAGNYTLSDVTNVSTDAKINKAILTVTAKDDSKIYNKIAYTSNNGVTYNGLVNNETATILGGALSYGGTSQNAVNAGTYTITASGLTSGNYDISFVEGKLTITKKDINILGLTGVNKTYDGTTTASLAGTATLDSSSIVSGDTASDVSVDLTGLVGNFVDKNVGNTKAINVSGITITGAKAGNYNVGAVTGLSADITKADLTVSGASASNKVYDATSTASVTGGSVTALLSDAVTLSSANATFANKNVGNGKTITTAYTISGTDAGNYNLLQVTGLTADITRADLTVSGAIASNKVYDATTTATVTGGSVTALLSDVVTLSAANATFANKNAANGKTITTAYTISGTDAGNYNLIQQTGLSADITKADLTVSGLTASNKVYDANTTATLGGTATITAIGSDVVTLGGTAVGTFANKNVGTSKTITISGNTISGTDAGNYNLVQQTGLTADITKADLTVSGAIASNKVYDATTTATVTGGSVTALLSDVVTLSAANATFANKNAANGKTITTAYTISGTDAGNYNLIQQTGLSADITKADLTVSGLTASNKVYDANTTATLGGTATITAIGSDVVTLGGTAVGTFANKNVGTSKTITISGNTISGTDAGNYNLVQQTGLTADITKADLTVSGLTIGSKTYDGTNSVTVSNAGTINKVTGDDVTLSTIATFNNKNVEANKTVNLDYTLSGNDAGNYSLLDVTGISTNALINVKPTTAQVNLKTSEVTGIPVKLDGILSNEQIAQGTKIVVLDSTNKDVTELAKQGKIQPGKYSVKAVNDNTNYSLTSNSVELTINPALDPATLVKIPVIPQLKIPSPNVGVVSSNMQISTPLNQNLLIKSVTNSGIIGEITGMEGSSNITHSSQIIEGQSNNVVTMNEQKSQNSSNNIENSNVSEFRVPLGNNSLFVLVGGGINLPDGVVQQYFMVTPKNNTINTSTNTNSETNDNKNKKGTN